MQPPELAAEDLQPAPCRLRAVFCAIWSDVREYQRSAEAPGKAPAFVPAKLSGRSCGIGALQHASCAPSSA